MIKKIFTAKDDCLHKVSEPVADNEDVSELIQDMFDTMHASVPKGIGLAANQIGVMKRVIVIDVFKQKQVLINPKIVTRSSKKVSSHEQCLSIPHIKDKNQVILKARQSGVTSSMLTKVLVVRNARVKVRALNANYEPVTLKFRGLAAVCVQHEIDHLNGITIVDRGD